MMSPTDVMEVIQLLLKGPSGWFIVAAGHIGSGLIVYFSTRRIYRTRPSTHALLGGEGKFAAQDDRDVEELFRAVDKCEERLREAMCDPQKAGRVANRMMDKCRELYRLNIAFRTQADRNAYLDRIEERWSQAEHALHAARRASEKAAA